jgi:DNA ligase-1
MQFAILARTFEELEGTSSRLTLIELLTQMFGSIERASEIEQVCYLVQGRVAPFYVALEMGMAEKSVIRSLALAYRSTLEHVEALYARLGDLGLVAAQVSSEAGGVPVVLSVDNVFVGLKAIAQASGKGAIEQKSARLSDLLSQVDSVSAKYVIRILLGNLRLGIGDATVLDALAKVRWNDTKKRKLLEGAYHKTSDLGLIARTLFEHPCWIPHW